MNLKQLLEKPINECSIDELEEQLRNLRRMKINTPKVITDGCRTGKTIKSNKDKQLSNMLTKLTPEQLKIFTAKLMEEGAFDE